MKLLLICLCSTFLSTSLSKKTYQIIIPDLEGFPYAKMHGTIDHPLVDFTLCHWSKVNIKKDWGTVFSYAVGTKYNSILTMTNESQNVGLWRDELELLSKQTGLENSDWLHSCITWSSVNNKAEIFINGIKMASKKVGTTYSQVPPNGVVILGQEQDSVGGRFDRTQTHVGQIADVNLWDFILTPNEISKLYSCIYVHQANVIDWDLVSWELYNGSRIAMVVLPCYDKMRDKI